MNIRYKYTDSELKNILKSLVVIVDTREQENSHILEYFDKHKIPYVVKALSNGDYSFYLPKNESYGIMRDMWFDKEIFVERKGSLTELAGNFSKNRDRFEKEMSTAPANTKYLLIENAQYSDVIAGNYRGEYNAKSFLGTLHTFNHRYELQLIFMEDKTYSPIFIYGAFQYYLREYLI